MKGIILAGGTGTRLYPLTQSLNKHLLPVGRYPMIFHGIHKLRKAGITDILIVTGRQHAGAIVQALGSGEDFGVSLTYKIQEQAGGIAQAVGLAEAFVNGETLVVLLGDNIFSDDLTPYVEDFKREQKGAKLLLVKVADPTRYGVPQMEQGRIVRIDEKPQFPKSAYAVTGVYMYDNQVFDIVKTLTPSSRGELEITDVNNAYIAKGELTFDILQGWWIDAGTHESLLLANRLIQGSAH